MRPQTVLDDLAAVELGEILEFLHDWIATCADARASLRRFTSGLFTVEELSADLARFAFLLGGDATAFLHQEHP